MRSKLKILLCLAIILTTLCGCTELWQEEREEVIERPNIEVEPDSPDWDNKEEQQEK